MSLDPTYFVLRSNVHIYIYIIYIFFSLLVLGLVCLLNKSKTQTQTWLFYKQTNMNALFVLAITFSKK